MEQLVLDEFGQKLLEELDYQQEARNLQDFYNNFLGDPYVKIPRVYKEYSGPRMLVMEWINGVRCTDPQVRLRLIGWCGGDARRATQLRSAATASFAWLLARGIGTVFQFMFSCRSRVM